MLFNKKSFKEKLNLKKEKQENTKNNMESKIVKNLNNKIKTNSKRFNNKNLIKSLNNKKRKNLKRLSSMRSLRKNMKIKNLITKKKHKIKIRSFNLTNQTEKISNIHKDNKNLTESNISTKTSPSKSNELNSKRQAEIKLNSKKIKRKNSLKTMKITGLKMDKNNNVKKAILNTILVRKWHIHHGKPNNKPNSKSLSNLSKAKKCYFDLLYLLKLQIFLKIDVEKIKQNLSLLKFHFLAPFLASFPVVA